MEMENIKRREALKRTAWIMGGTLSVPTIAGIMNGCTPSPELTWLPKFFSEVQAKTIMEVAECILPKTSTPGAKDMGVPAFIEEMVSLCYGPAERTRFSEGLEQFMVDCKTAYGEAFYALEKAEQLALLNKLNSDLKTQKTPVTGFFRNIKELTVVGYYTTEYGTTQELQYEAVPVNYEACIPLSEAGNGKTWATF